MHNKCLNAHIVSDQAGRSMREGHSMHFAQTSYMKQQHSFEVKKLRNAYVHPDFGCIALAKPD